MRKFLKVLVDAICAVLIICLVFFIISTFKAKSDPNHVPGIGSFKLMYVLTGSMRPVIEPGDLIIAKNVDVATLKEGDIITFRVSQDTLVTHRIIGINEDGSFVTKGDANNVEDLDFKAGRQNIVGKYVFRIPKGGYVAKFIQSPMGMILFILIPVGIFTIGETRNFLKELEEDDNKQKQITI